jgi:hypothetical protein
MPGFALTEVLVAAGLIATGLLALAQLMAMTIAVNAGAAHDTSATLLAAQKIEELRTCATGPQSESIEHIDSSGRVVGSGSSLPLGAIYLRRSAVRAMPSAPARLLVIQVSVEPVAFAARSAERRRREAARFITVTTLTPP